MKVYIHYKNARNISKGSLFGRAYLGCTNQGKKNFQKSWQCSKWICKCNSAQSTANVNLKFCLGSSNCQPDGHLHRSLFHCRHFTLEPSARQACQDLGLLGRLLFTRYSIYSFFLHLGHVLKAYRSANNTLLLTGLASFIRIHFLVFIHN